MKTKETLYNGYSFRSRTEARWAVYFDAMYMKYHYEYEDFILSNGKRYLPDFYLPDMDIHVEVKGVATQEEREQLWMFSREYKTTIVLAEGPPDFRIVEFFSGKDNINKFGTALFYPEDNRLYIEPGIEGCGGYFEPYYWLENHNEAVHISRSARFECF